MAEPVVPIRASTQQFTEIEDITQNIVLFSNGSCAVILSVAAVNFSLLSAAEQESMIYTYAGILNSLSFPIQILVRSKHKDISAYLHLLEDKEREQTNPKLAESIRGYRAFIESTVKEKEVLDKKFYIIIPFSNLELGVSPGVLFSTKKSGLPYQKSYVIERALIALTPKRDHLLRLLSKLGLKAQQLTNDQLTQLFFSLYNPGVAMPTSLTNKPTK
jgi:hypothetical protein